MNLSEQAKQRVIDFVLAIEKWFNGTGEETLEDMATFFSNDFNMQGASGVLMNFEQLYQWLPGIRGLKPGIKITLDNIKSYSTFFHVLVYYEEQQVHADSTTKRRSSAIFQVEGETLKWKELKEEWI